MRRVGYLRFCRRVGPSRRRQKDGAENKGEQLKINIFEYFHNLFSLFIFRS